jgi:hypothetical protein
MRGSFCGYRPAPAQGLRNTGVVLLRLRSNNAKG